MSRSVFMGNQQCPVIHDKKWTLYSLLHACSKSVPLLATLYASKARGSAVLRCRGDWRSWAWGVGFAVVVACAATFVPSSPNGSVAAAIAAFRGDVYSWTSADVTEIGWSSTICPRRGLAYICAAIWTFELRFGDLGGAVASRVKSLPPFSLG